MVGAGSPGRAIVMRNGSESEMTSGLLGAETDVIKEAPGLAQDANRAQAASEMYVVVDLNKRSTGTPANVPLRGIEPTSLAIRPEIRIIDGRMLRFGTNEAVVGRAALSQFSGVDLGSHYQSGQLDITIVGVFASGGSVAESEIWCDSKVLQSAYRRGNSYQSVLAKLDSPSSFDTFKNWLTTNPQLNVNVKRESDYYLSQTEVMTSLINGIGYVIATLMGVGAVFGAILTMYTAVATRTREIATLRALGFNTLSVLVSVLGESLVLAAIGGAAGGAPRLPGLQRLPDVDDELPDVQPGGVRVRGHAGAAPPGPELRAHHGLHRRTVPGDPRGASADRDGAAGAVGDL